MRKLAVVLAVAAILGAGQAATAANLAAGWYVKLHNATLTGIDPVTHQLTSVGWAFSGGLGAYGPFTVSDQNPPWTRTVSVATASGVLPGTGVVLTGSPGAMPTFPVTDMTFAYQTWYDASQMRLDVLLIHANGSAETIYSETRSVPISTVGGAYMGSAGYLQPGDSIAFRVATVPEPSSACSLFCLLLLGLPAIRRATR